MTLLGLSGDPIQPLDAANFLDSEEPTDIPSVIHTTGDAVVLGSVLLLADIGKRFYFVSSVYSFTCAVPVPKWLVRARGWGAVG